MAESPVVRRRAPLIAGAVVAGSGATVLTAWSTLNGDVTYALGGMETAEAGGVSVWDVFVARPIAYRLLLSGLDAGRELLVGDASALVKHTVLRAGTAVVIALVAIVLFLGVRRFLGGRTAAATATATGLALIVSPPWHFLEPDWVAPLAAVLAVGAALAPHRAWLGGVLGGVAALITITVKLATAPVALIALVLIAVLSLRRAAWATVTTAVLTVVWYVVTKLWLPWEWIWFNDQAKLVANSPIHHAPRLHDLHRLVIGVGDVAVLSPLVAVAPAAAVVLIRRQPAGRPRWVAAGVAVVVAGLSVAPAYGQGEFFMYHFAVLPILAAGICGVAFGLCAHARRPLAASALVLSAASLVLLRQPPGWRLAHNDLVTGAYLLAAVLAAVVAWRRFRPAPWLAGAIALAAALAPAVLPGAPYSFSTYNYKTLNHQTRDGGYAALSERIGPETPVLYLSFGSINYQVGNPTSCRYPSPQWLQRGSTMPQVRAYRSYADNLLCLTGAPDARYLIWQPHWFDLPTASPQVQALIKERFDCSAEARVPAPADLVVCPARA